MNERIRELAEQCRIETYGADGELLEFGFDEGKFAELIVRECAGIAYEYDAPKMSGPGMIIAGRIETHFGVEE